MSAAFAVDPPPDGGYPNQNTAEGEDALLALTTGFANTAIGFEALSSNTSGDFNTANGSVALLSNTFGSFNTATGYGALEDNTTGSSNTATGYGALARNTSGISNTAIGATALMSLTTGGDNTAIGLDALYQNTDGSSNIAVGAFAGGNVKGSNNIDIGNGGKRRDSNSIRIGMTGTQNATFIAGISGATVPTGVAVIIDANGHLGTTTSSARFKDKIKPMDKASEAILALKPVTFRYNKELDPDGIPQFGLIAEDVEKVNADLVVRDEQGKAYTVRYEAVNAMLFNEFLKARRQIDAQQKQIEALTAGLQKVSAQIELSKPAPQMVLNSQ